jgi:hypothetical protein
MTKIRSQERMYNVITTLKFKTHYNPVNYNNKTGFHNNNGKRWKCEKCSNRFFKNFKEVKIIKQTIIHIRYYQEHRLYIEVICQEPVIASAPIDVWACNDRGFQSDGNCA